MARARFEALEAPPPPRVRSREPVAPTPGPGLHRALAEVRRLGGPGAGPGARHRARARRDCAPADPAAAPQVQASITAHPQAEARLGGSRWGRPAEAR